jgi:hypothetical protein
LGNQIRFAQFDDGDIRGGIIGSTRAAVEDTLRIGKFLVDFPRGPLFIAKQVGLQLSNPKLEVGRFQNVRGESLAAGVINQGINILNQNSIGATRIYNLGINTL